MGKVTPVLKRGMGWKPSRPSKNVKAFLPKLLKESDLPQQMDLRPAMGAVYDQGQLGSCTANGTAALAQHRMIVSHYPWMFVPSRLFIYYNTRAKEGTVSFDSGGEVSDAVATINEFGVCPESEADGSTPNWLWPYSDSQGSFFQTAPFKQKPPTQCYKNATLHKALQDQTVALDRLTILNTLAQGNPIVFGQTLYSSFESQETLETGIMQIPGDDESELGGHCMSICGYFLDMPLGTQGVSDWGLIRNSWGTGIYNANPKLGNMAGYFLMPLNEVLCNSSLTSDLHIITLMSGEQR